MRRINKIFYYIFTLFILFCYQFSNVNLNTHVAHAASGESVEDDNWSTAINFNVGDSKTSNLIVELDVDFYKTYIKSQGVLTLSLSHVDLASSSNYFKVTVYNSNLTTVSTFYVDGLGTISNEYKINVNTGDYYISVGKGAMYSNTNYTLNTSVVYDVVSGSVIEGNIRKDIVNKYNTYEINLTKPAYLEFSAWSSTSGLSSSKSYWTITIYDSNSNAIYSKSVTGDTSEQKSSKIGVDSGKYTFVMAEGNYFTETNYKLKINWTYSDYWEKENNNDMSSATSIFLNQKYSGVITVVNDLDYYRFITTVDGVVSINFSHEYSNDTQKRWQVIILDSKGNVMNETYLSLKNDNYNLPNIGLLPGTYYIKIMRYNDLNWSQKEYNFTVGFQTTTEWEKEPNDLIENATYMNFDVTYNGSIHKAEDLDYYKFITTVDGVVSINFSHEYSNDTQKRWQVIILDSRGNVMRETYLSLKDDNYNLPNIGLLPGTYYIKIMRYTDLNWSSIDYNLTVKFVASTVWEKEANDTTYDATPVNLNTRYNGSTYKAEDIDYYKFTTTSNGVVDIYVTHEYFYDDNSKWIITVLDSRETEIVKYYFAGIHDKFYFPSMGLTPGEYYIKVTGYNSSNWSSINYSLTVGFSMSENWEKESNESLDTATPIDYYTYYQGTIVNKEDIDYYKFTQYETDDLLLRFEAPYGTSTSKYFSVSLMNERSTVLKSSTVTLSAGFIVLEQKDLAPGTYYIKIVYNTNLSTDVYRLMISNPHECYGYWKTTISATCTSYGEQQKHCSTCGVFMEKQVINPYGHIYGEYSSIDGHTHGKECSRCNNIVVENHEFSNPVVTKEPTCKEQGIKVYTCIYCNETYEELIPLLTEHKFNDAEYYNENTHCVQCECGEIEYINHNYVILENSDSTCEKEGYIIKECVDCKHQITETIKEHGHEYGDWYVVKQPTCVETGTEQRDCEHCDASETREIVAKGHNYEEDWTIDKEATCEEKGSKSHHCTQCGDKSDVTEIAATGHEYGDWYVTKQPTCEETGTEQRDCEHCDESETREIAAKGHDYEEDWTIDQEATCEGKGSKSHHCTQCGDKSDVTEIAANGHEYGDWYVTKQPTCEGTGIEQRDCEHCDASETREIAAKGHSYEEEWTIDQEATCEEKGSKSHHCTQCGDKSDVTEIAATGHEYGDWYVTKQPTCEEAGIEQRDCEHCDASETREIVAKGHDYEEEWTIDQEATCEEKGSKSHHCTQCGDKSDVTEIAAAGHEYGDWYVTKQPTCEETGTEQRDCEHCDESETREIAAKGHEYSNHKHNSTTHWDECECGAKNNLSEHEGNWLVTKNPTTEEFGEETYNCSCGYIEMRNIPMLEKSNVASYVVGGVGGAAGIAGLINFLYPFIKKKNGL